MKVVAFAVAAVLSSVALAEAADLPVRRAAPMPPPVPSPIQAPIPGWAGLYLGLHAGYLAGGGEVTFPGTDEFHFIDPKGFVGGGLIGYQLQTGQFVYGIEGDIAYVNAKESIATAFGPVPTATELATRFDWNSHLRGRLGVARGNFLFFAAGGLALAGVENSATDNTAGVTASWSDVRAGWSLGGGVDMQTAWHAVVRVEYLYDNYGKQGLEAQTVGPVTFAPRDHELDSHTVRAAITWKFPSP